MPVQTNQLTAGEVRILHLLSHGHTQPYIAELLGVSVNTVRTHVRNIYEKLGVHRRDDAVAWYWHRSPSEESLEMNDPPSGNVG